MVDSDYTVYPAVDKNNNFPPPVRAALVNSSELAAGIKKQVSDNLAADPTVSAAAATAANAAVAAALDNASIFRDVLPTQNDDISVSFVDQNGLRSWLEVYRQTGGPTTESANLILKAIQDGIRKVVGDYTGQQVIGETSDAVYAIVDQEGRVAFQINRDGTLIGKLALPAQSITPSQFSPAAISLIENGVATPLLETTGTSPNRSLWVHLDNGERALIANTGDPRNAYISRDQHVIYTTGSGTYRASIDGKTVTPAFPKRAIGTVGDSLTANGIYPEKLRTRFNLPLTNLGMSGWSSGDIAIRQGGLQPALTVANNQIPASGPVTVTSVTPSDSYTGFITDYDFVWTGTLAGVPGTLVRSHKTNVPTTWTFTRTNAGSAVDCPAGTKFVGNQGDGIRDAFQVIFCGRNNPGSVVARDVTSMVDFLSPYRKEFLVVSVINNTGETRGTAGYNTVTAMNDQLKTLFPRNYYDLRPDFINQVLPRLGRTPTAEDAANIANDAPPPSIMADATHPNSDGYGVIGDLLAEFITKKGWAS